MNAEERLKPCPFCEGKAKMRDWREEDKNDPCVVVKCTQCGAESNLFDGPSLPDNKDQAIAAWNRRDTAARREAMEECVEIVEGLRNSGGTIDSGLCTTVVATAVGTAFDLAAQKIRALIEQGEEEKHGNA